MVVASTPGSPIILIQKLTHHASGLFVRNFLLLMTLMMCCLGIWFAVFLRSGLEARANEMSKRVASAVNLTRTALHYAQLKEQSDLLADLSRHESLDVHVRQQSDLTIPLPAQQYWQHIQTNLHAYLGADTVIAWEVNRQPAFWVSFKNNQDQYWLAFERHEISEGSPMQWAGWIFGAILLSLIGAMISTRYVNRPLTRLARFAKSLSSGQMTAPLPETGAREILLVNTSFNRMAQALRETEVDREMMLAGLSHDLRTPLTRMRLEIEMSPMPDATRVLIDTDLEQVDHSINKLIEYARASGVSNTSSVQNTIPMINISRELSSLIVRERELIESQGGTFNTDITPDLYVQLEPFNLQRIITNVLENAKRYGRNASGVAEVFVRLDRTNQEVCLEITDTGKGMTRSETETLLRPFSRGDTARTGGIGTGLGLAIVERLVKQANGQIRLLSHPDAGASVQAGLSVQITLPGCLHPGEPADSPH